MVKHLSKYVYFKERVIGESLIPEEVVWYIFSHPRGDCLAYASAGIGYKNLGQKAKALAKRDPKNSRRYLLTQKQLIRFAELRYCWTPAIGLAYQFKLKPSAFCRYAEQGHFGPTIYDLYGRLCLRAELKNNQDTVVQKHKKIAQKNRNPTGIKSPVGKDELVPAMIAQMIGDFTPEGVIYWCKKGWLKSTKRGQYLIIKKSDLLAFMERVLKREIFIWHTTRDEFPRIISEHLRT